MRDALEAGGHPTKPLRLVEIRAGVRRKRMPTILTMNQYQKLLEREELGIIAGRWCNSPCVWGST